MQKTVFIVGLLLSILGTSAVSAQGFQAGTDYRVLSSPVEPVTDDGKVEVVEVFSYHCPHCYRFDPVLKSWAESAMPDSAELIHLPVVFRASWEPGARAYYIAETLGILDQTHVAFFQALHEQGINMSATENLANFFADFGVSREEFDRVNGSFQLDTTLRRAQKLAQEYRIMGVPTIVVNGKYEVSGSMAGSLERMLDIVEYLIQQEVEAAG